MAKAIFLCHASSEAPLARTMCAALEARGLSCWIAPRDVPAGAHWGRAIVDAIAACELMVLIYSEASNASPQVLREVERAVHHRRDILPFRLVPVEPSKDIEYFISASQWFDAFPGPPEEHLDRLCDAIASLLNAFRATPPDAHLPVVMGTPVVPGPTAKRKRPRQPALIGGALLLLLLLAGAGFWLKTFLKPRRPATESVVLKQPAEGASFARPTLMLEWEPAESLDPQGLSFELQTWMDNAPPTTTRLTRDSCVLDGMEGLIHWQVRPVWRQPDGRESTGEWSQPHSFTYYRDALSRLLHTHTLHVGIAEADGIFVVDDAGRITGAEIELLRAIGDRILQGNHVNDHVTITYSPTVWGDKFFHLLGDEGIDLLASGISISAEREKLYGLAFTRHTFEYPQTFIIHAGTATADADGKLALQALGVVEHTTNQTLAQTLTGPAGSDRLKLYKGSGSYFKMINDLVAGALDGVLMDQPYALKYVADFKRRQPASDLTTEDATVRLAPRLPSEQIGFALRRGDAALRTAINAQIEALEPLKQTLIQKYITRADPALASPAP